MILQIILKLNWENILPRQCLILFLLFFVVNTTSVGAQEASFSDLVDDGEALLTTENAWWLLAGASATVLVYQVEDPEGAVKGLNESFLDPLFDFGNIWGDARVQIPLALGCWAVGSMRDDDHLALFGYDLSRGVLLTYGVTSIGKYAFQRTRPNGDPYSFPSGHTSMAFTTAGVMSRHYGPWGTVAGVTLGVLTGLGRMEDNKHYASDVVAGATIGWIIGRTVARNGPSQDSAWQLVPSVNGVVLVGRFN
jgi:membrane-associated phospholipid phosphatase